MKGSARDLVRRTSVIGVLLLLVIGCSDGASDRAENVPDGTPVATAAIASDDTAPPNLPSTWSGMTSQQIIRHLSNHGYYEAGRTETSQRECSDGQASANCNLVITPAAGVRKFDTATVNANGVIIGRIHNVGTLGEAHLGIPARDTLYWLVVRNDGVLKSYLVDLAETKPRGQNRANFLPCPLQHHDVGPNVASRAEFRRCPASPESAGAVDTVAMTSDNTSPPWTTCSLGCCYADVPGG